MLLVKEDMTSLLPLPWGWCCGGCEGPSMVFPFFVTRSPFYGYVHDCVDHITCLALIVVLIFSAISLKKTVYLIVSRGPFELILQALSLLDCVSIILEEVKISVHVSFVVLAWGGGGKLKMLFPLMALRIAFYKVFSGVKMVLFTPTAWRWLYYCLWL